MHGIKVKVSGVRGRWAGACVAAFLAVPAVAQTPSSSLTASETASSRESRVKTFVQRWVSMERMVDQTTTTLEQRIRSIDQWRQQNTVLFRGILSPDPSRNAPKGPAARRLLAQALFGAPAQRNLSGRVQAAQLEAPSAREKVRALDRLFAADADWKARAAAREAARKTFLTYRAEMEQSIRDFDREASKLKNK